MKPLMTGLKRSIIMNTPFIGIIAILAGLAMADDQWISSGRDNSFPQERYFVGIGQSDRSQDAAKRNALVEVQKQISVSINATVRDDKSYSIVKGKATSSDLFESRAQMSTTGEVQGIEVVKTGMQGKNYFALAVLDKRKFASNCRTGIAESRTELMALVKGAAVDIDSLQIGSALMKLSAADRLMPKIADLRKLLSAAEALTDAESVPCSPAEIAQLYATCISSIKMERFSGDGQSGEVGSTPAEPFVVTVTAGEAPLSGLTVNLIDEANKIVRTGNTDDNGSVSFTFENACDMPAGKHFFTAAIDPGVSPDLKKMLAVQNQKFSYTVVSNPCFVKITVDAGENLSAGKKEIVEKVKERLYRLDVKDAGKSDQVLFVTVSAAETEKGKTDKSGLVETAVSLHMVLKDDEGREIGSFGGSSRGSGKSLAASVVSGIAAMPFGKNLGRLLDTLRASKSDASKPMVRIQVFEFKEQGTPHSSWPDLSKSLSEMIVTRLLSSGKVVVVERSQLNLINEQRALEQSGLMGDIEEDSPMQNAGSDEKESLKAATLAGADLALMGSGEIVGNKIEIDARIVELKSGIARCSMSSGSYQTSNLRALADDLVGQVKGNCLKSK